MLVSKRQDWDQYAEQPVSIPAPAPRLNVGLRNKCFIVVFIGAIMAMVITARSEAIIRAGYDLVQVKAQVAGLEKQNELLRLDIAKLKSPQRIQAIATKELGMVVPTNVYCAAAKPQKNSAAGINVAEKEQSVTSQVANMVKTARAEASKQH
ncbi:cell division protein ftsl [Lucifera butyrica]|uniref:Cell division protein ftsl n=1 Tax=Lucifera butyrica TaxID=1351585 RepID=A0A498R0Z2_9FIRM|nr:cell division protein FtsL [Lucifera butyrica]VBB06226.1 cell division protein ftsl [Lucifera butyrica]